ncbi:putative flippase GtrA [Catenulispora sp. EB89]|uniref:GtrA family protein n=1 Tax=Catenulispora sp. EB89 TaxID=3156257 RepID=UPI003512552D
MTGLIRTLAKNTFVRYAFSGGSALVTEEVVLYLTHGLMKFPLWLATGLAYLIAFGVNFSINRMLTFADHGAREGAMHKQTVRFALLVCVNLGVTQVLMYSLTGAGVNYLIAKPLSTVVITLYNFWLYKHWVFKPETALETETGPELEKAGPGGGTGARSVPGAPASEAPASEVSA